MYEKLKKENNDKYLENFNKRIKLAHQVNTANSIEEARSLLTKMKELEEELKAIDLEQGMIHRYSEISRTNPAEESGIKVKKGIGLT